MNAITIEPIRPEFADELEQLQRACFPTLGEQAILKRTHFLNHCELFPEGNLVAITEGRIVGLGSGFLTDFDFNKVHHSFNEKLAGGFFTDHNPNGEYYYGADISVHPQYRRRGIGGMIYDGRKAVVKRLNRRGIVAGGLIPGFAHHKHRLSAKEYMDAVVAGELYDSTLSFQLRQGFRAVELLENYLDDAASDNWAVLIVWDNPDYQP